MLDSANVFTLLKSSEKFLESSGVPDPKTDAEVLLSAAMKVKRSQLPLMRELKPADAQTELFSQYLQKRSKREPVAYITGLCGFMGLEFKVDENVLIPRPETELLVENVLKSAKKSKCEKILDLCTGSGCIAVTLAKMGDFKEVTASDVSFDALFLAKENAAANAVHSVEFLLSDMFDGLENMKFDCIVSNPPYVSEEEYAKLEPELKFEPKIALTASDNGMFFYKEIASMAGKFLNENGGVFIELSSNHAEEISTIFKGTGFTDIEIINDYSDLPRILKARIQGN